MIDEPLSLRVLIADDESIARDILQFYLESLGCRVLPARDGDEALALFGAAGATIDLVILDVCMPGPPPLELYGQFRRISQKVSVLYCSGVAADDPLSRELSANSLHLLSKPFNRSDLRYAIQELMVAREAQPLHRGEVHRAVLETARGT